ncbi:unnamed protein product, partial [Adineta steineri]
MSVGDKYHRDEFELQHMVTNEHQQETVAERSAQQHRLKTTTHGVSKTKIKIVYAGLLLLFIVSGGIIALNYYRTAQASDVNIEKKQGKTDQILK